MLYGAVETKKMEKLQKNIQNDFLTILCKTDFYNLLDACEATEDMSKKVQLVNEIEKKLDALNVAYDVNAEINNKIKRYKVLVAALDIPETTDGLEEKIWDEIHNNYLLFPSAEQYIARIVDELGDPGFADDTLRVRILKQFKKYLNVKSDSQYFNREIYSRKLESMPYEAINDSLFDEIKYEISVDDEVLLMLEVYREILVFSNKERETLSDLLCQDNMFSENPEEYADLLAETIKQNPSDDETLLKIKKLIENNLSRNFESLQENCIVPDKNFDKKLEKEKADLDKFRKKSPEFKIKTFIKTFSDDGYNFLSEKSKKQLNRIITAFAGEGKNDSLSALTENYKDSKELKEIYEFVLNLMNSNNDNLENYIYRIEEKSDYRKRLEEFTKIFTTNDLLDFKKADQKVLAEKILSFKKYADIADVLVLELISEVSKVNQNRGQGLLKLTYRQIKRNFQSYINNSDSSSDKKLMFVYSDLCRKSYMESIKYFRQIIGSLNEFKFSDSSKRQFRGFFKEIKPEWGDTEILDYIISMQWKNVDGRIFEIIRSEYDNCPFAKTAEENGELTIDNMTERIIASGHHLSDGVRSGLIDLIIGYDNKLIFRLIDNAVKADKKLETQKTYEISQKFEEIYIETYNERWENSEKYRKYHKIKNEYNSKITEKKKTFSDNKFNRWFIRSDNLAKGRFGKSRAIKKPLYYFAFAFNMKYYSSTNQEDYDKQKDIKKRLFEDYYSDNLISFLSAEPSKEVEAEPSGYSINFKNFAEVIYLYYLNKEGLTPAEKLSCAENVINKIKKSESGKGRNYNTELTKDYRIKVNDEVFRLEEGELENYITDNFYCDDKYMKSNLGALEISDEQRTAFEEYTKIIDEINKTHTAFCNDNGYYIRYYEDFDFIVLPEPYSSDDRFCKLIDRIKLKIKTDEVLKVNDNAHITRTKMIAAYYYLYCYKCLSRQDNINTGLDRIYSDFKLGLNDILEKSGYQKISPKNIFDSVIIIFAYCKINDIF
ncbi:MAG: hypothetical protein ACI4XI_01425 [Ruminococcus sp.]